jgi:hypothetical protein
MTRKPSCLISCSDASPPGGWGALVGRHGGTKPRGRGMWQPIGRGCGLRQTRAPHGGPRAAQRRPHNAFCAPDRGSRVRLRGYRRGLCIGMTRAAAIGGVIFARVTGLAHRPGLVRLLPWLATRSAEHQFVPAAGAECQETSQRPLAAFPGRVRRVSIEPPDRIKYSPLGCGLVCRVPKRVPLARLNRWLKH